MPTDATRVDPLSSSRELAFRAVLWQALASALAGVVAWAATGPLAGVAALLGGGALVLGNAAATQLALGGGVQSARSAYLRLWFGMLVKWLFVVAVWLAAMAVLKQAPLAAIAGLVAAMLAHPAAIILAAKVKRER
jgi:F0F1-type ATP synthase assembly protein I